MEKRSFFDIVFGKNKQSNAVKTSMKMMSGYTPYFSDFNADAYESDVVRSVIDTIARHAGKFKPKHIRYLNGKIEPSDSYLDELLSLYPNPYMDAYNFIYKVVTNLYLSNNAFVLVQYDETGKVNGFYPITSSNVELLEANRQVFVKFMFYNGDILTVPYSEIIHLKRFFYKNDFYGESSLQAITPMLELINTTNQGIINAIKSSAYIRGILKFTMTLKPEAIKQQRDAFIAEYLDITNNGGVAATDAKADYIPLSNEAKMVDANHMKFIEEKVYKYFNVSENIVKSCYNEEEFNAFFESILEPIALQFSLQFTEKVFTKRERGFGNKVIFEANRLQYASNTTKIELIKAGAPIGMFTINDMREIFNMSPVEDGDIRLQSLNFVDAKKANEYQLGVKEDDAKEESSADDSENGEGDTPNSTV